MRHAYQKPPYVYVYKSSYQYLYVLRASLPLDADQTNPLCRHLNSPMSVPGRYRHFDAVSYDVTAPKRLIYHLAFYVPINIFRPRKFVANWRSGEISAQPG